MKRWQMPETMPRCRTCIFYRPDPPSAATPTQQPQSGACRLYPRHREVPAEHSCGQHRLKMLPESRRDGFLGRAASLGDLAVIVLFIWGAFAAATRVGLSGLSSLAAIVGCGLLLLVYLELFRLNRKARE